MTQLRRHLPLADIGAGKRFASVQAAIDWYASIGLRLVSETDDTLTFGVNVRTTQEATFDGRTLHDVFVAHQSSQSTPKSRAAAGGRAKAAKRHYRQENCAKCGGERDLGLKRALCRACYNADKNAQYAKKKGKAA